MTKPERTLLLFDIDEVLVHPIGYDVAMRRAIEHFAAQMGLDITGPTDEDIAAFHAYGMTNEWLSGALSLAALMVEATAGHPELIRATLSGTMQAIRESGVISQRPDYAALAKASYQHNGGVVHTSAPILVVLRKRTSSELHLILEEVLGNIRPPSAPFAIVFQQYSLGPQKFTEVYDLQATIDCEICLEMDEAFLNEQVRARLQHILSTDHCGAAIYTARPSLPPKGLSAQEQSAVERRIHPPEAEMAAEIAGLSDLPLVGAGSMAWLAIQRSKAIDAYVKPSPVQALAGIGAAFSGNVRAALDAAGQFVEDGSLTGPLAQLATESTHIIVFEDSSGGIRAVRQAAEMLRAAGVDIRVTGVGISEDRVKRDILGEIADVLAGNVNEGLTGILDSFAGWL
jgi:hypothetical protein